MTKALNIIFGTIFGLALVNCAGGGSQGTSDSIGAKGVIASGHVVDRHGHNVPNVAITSLVNGETTSTKADGTFSFVIRLTNNNGYNLDFSDNKFSESIQLMITGQRISQVHLEVTFDSQERIFEITRVDEAQEVVLGAGA